LGFAQQWINIVMGMVSLFFCTIKWQLAWRLQTNKRYKTMWSYLTLSIFISSWGPFVPFKTSWSVVAVGRNLGGTFLLFLKGSREGAE
jgi:cytochrome bd-type quinol oxidase subunit 1